MSSNTYMTKRFWVLIILVPLFLGLTIYIFLRPTAFISKAFYHIFSISPSTIKAPDNVFWHFIKYYFCDFLWAFSLSATVSLIIGIEKKKLVISFLVCSIVAICTEFFQLQGFIFGTFDILDVLIEIIGVILPLMIIHLRRRNNEKQIS